MCCTGKTHNPSRGCGMKKPDSFYIESSGSTSGSLGLWTWLLDDGEVHHSALLWQVPARQALIFKIIESILAASLIKEDDFFHVHRAKDLLVKASLENSVPRIGIVDHVGKTHYSAWSFAREVFEHGVSRRISKKTAVVMAEAIQKYGAVPIVFTHDRMPLFYNEQIQSDSIDFAYGCTEIDLDVIERVPTWLMESWGAYLSKGQHSGYNHFLIPVLSVIHALDMKWSLHLHSEPHIAAKEFFKQLDYSERPFGMSWITDVTYTVDKESTVKRSDLQGIPGLRILDLDEDRIKETL